MRSVRMSDVAQQAGVSLATVGRVIHNNGYVEKATRQRIEQAIAQLGYLPNKTARNLKNQSSSLIGHLVVLNANMLFQKISAAVDAAADKAGYCVLTMAAKPGQKGDEAAIDEFLSQNVAGLIITSNASISVGTLAMLVKKEVPVVMVERTRTVAGVDRITVDDFGGAYAATEALIKKGRKKLAMVCSSKSDRVEKERLAGFQAATRDYGLSGRRVYAPGDYSQVEGLQAARQALAEGPVDGFFCASDILAAGVMQYLYSQNIRIPDQVSVTGYDDTASQLLSPPISSVALSLEEIGQRAVGLLKARMADFHKPDEEICTKTRYIERNT